MTNATDRAVETESRRHYECAHCGMAFVRRHGCPVYRPMCCHNYATCANYVDVYEHTCTGSSLLSIGSQ